MTDGARALPTRLGKEPLIEAVWELQYDATQPAAAEILTGLVYARLKESFGIISADPMPLSNVPAKLRLANPQLRYQAVTKVSGKQFSVLIGPNVVALSSLRPYSGWQRFRAGILEVLALVCDAGLVGRPVRFSLKYVDAITVLNEPSLTGLNVHVNIAGQVVSVHPIQLRVEIQRDNYLHVLTVASPVDVTLAEVSSISRAVAVDVDTIISMPADADAREFVRDHLDSVHTANKRLFFDVLTPDTERLLEPLYAEP